MNDVITYTETQRKNYDPTRTTALRQAFWGNMNRRFRNIMVVIKKSVVDQDCFGLSTKVIQSMQLTPAGTGQFSYVRSSAKVEEFMKWLRQQVDKELLTVGQYQQIGSAVEAAWTNMYILDSYKRGIIRARYELQKAGYKVPSIDESGGIDIVIGLPFHVDSIGLLFTRVFSDLKGITAAMDMQISRVLAQGMADGDGMRLIARKLLSTISGTDMQKLGITDTLGRFIPAQVRAEMLVRTEIIRAFNMAAIQEYRNWGAEGIVVKAEWKTVGDSRVCEKCFPMEGKIFTLDEAEGKLPYHPNCRCIFLPLIIN